MSPNPEFPYQFFADLHQQALPERIFPKMSVLREAYLASLQAEGADAVGEHLDFAPYEPLETARLPKEPKEQDVKRLAALASLPRIVAVMVTTANAFTPYGLAQETGYSRQSVYKNFENHILPLGIVQKLSQRDTTRIASEQPQSRGFTFYRRSAVLDRYIERIPKFEQAIRLRTIAYSLHMSEDEAMEFVLNMGEVAAVRVIGRNMARLRSKTADRHKPRASRS